MRRRDLILGSAALAVKPRKWFSEVTAHVFGGTASFRNQLAKGIPYWRARLDAACGIDVYGSQGIAVGDIDNDGRDEIYVCQPGGLLNRMYKIRDDGTATDVTAESHTGILDDTSSALFFDTRNRGLQDLIVLRPGGPLLFVNRGDGSFDLERDAFRFTRAPQGSFTGMAAADYDGDGFVDLYLCSYIYFQSEDQYRYPSPYHDARNGPPNFLFRNLGGSFLDVTAESGIDENNNRYSFAAAWCDYDNDGRQELYVANDFGRNNLYKYDGRRFRDIAAEAGVEDIGPGMSVAWFDYDNDGRFDLYVGNMWTPIGQRVVADKKLEPADAFRRHAKGNSLYRNLGNGKFEETRQAEMGRWAWSSDACDFDNDGSIELYIACGMITGDRPADAMQFFWENVVAQSGDAYERGWNTINQRIREGDSWAGHEPNVFYTCRKGVFADESEASGLDFADDSRAFAFTDFDSDGNVDILLKSRLGPQVRVLRNERGVGKPVIAIHLRGTKSNRDGIGAVVTIGNQTKQVSAGSGYLSQHSKTLFFAATANNAQIRWPSGQIQKIPRLMPGAIYTVIEGEPQTKRSEFRKRLLMKSEPVAGDNTTEPASFRLVEPVPMADRAILGKYIRDLRRELPNSAIFHTDKDGQLTDIQIGPDRAESLSPFPGQYVAPPVANLLKLGTAFYLRKQPEAALLYLEAETKRQPENAKTWLAIGQIRMELNQVDRAAEPFDRYFALKPDADTADQIGLIYAKRQRHDEARQWFQSAIERKRDHASAINNLGVLYGEMGKYDDAIAAFEYGLEAAPDDDTLYMNLGRIYVRAGRRERAKAVMERLLERKPGNQTALRALQELR